jgi:hypothetical protein
MAPNILVTPVVSYPSHATGLRQLNDQSDRSDGKSHSTFSVPPVHSSSCDIGLNARFIKTQKKFLTEFQKLYALWIKQQRV